MKKKLLPDDDDEEEVAEGDGVETLVPAAREPIANRTRNTLEINEDNTVKATGNGSTNTGENKERMRQTLSDQKQRKLVIMSFVLALGPRVCETGNESSCQRYI